MNKLCIAILCLLPITACVGPGVDSFDRHLQVRAECKAVARQNGLTGESYVAFMQQCPYITGRSTGASYGPVTQAPISNQSTYGKPDAFGPYGVWGPSWQEFNQTFQSGGIYGSPVLPPINSAPGAQYGKPDAFGPYGVWGPSWQDFNQTFQRR